MKFPYLYVLYTPQSIRISGAGTGGARGATGPPIFGRPVNPIPIMGGRFCPPFTSGTPNVFHLPASLLFVAFSNCIILCQIYETCQARLWACGRGDMSAPIFGSYPNPISTRGRGGADYAHPILMFTPSFESHRRACLLGQYMYFI